MSLTKYKLGELIEKYDEKCGEPNLTEFDVSGINREKEFFEPSKQVGKNTENYKCVPVEFFATNLMHVGRDIVLPIAFNHSKSNKIVSPAYTIFKIKNSNKVLNEFLFMYFNSKEKDRYFWFFTDASIRDGLSWEDFCDIEINLPSIEIQKKYVAIYQAMLKNQQAYEEGLEDLKLACDGTLDNLRKKFSNEKLKNYISRRNEKNTDNKIKNVKGVSTSKEFREPTSKVNKDKLSNYKIVKPKEISFVQTTHNEKVFAYAFNNTDEDIVVTSVNEVFSTSKDLLPEYLSMFFNRKEFDRYARFHSWGSARETFTWEDMCEVQIPIPPLEIQKSIANIYKVYTERKEINEKLKEQIKSICPILIKGAIKEAGRREE